MSGKKSERKEDYKQNKQMFLTILAWPKGPKRSAQRAHSFGPNGPTVVVAGPTKATCRSAICSLYF